MKTSNRQPRFIDQKVRYAFIRNGLPPVPARVCEVGIGSGLLFTALHEVGYDGYGCDVSLRSLPSDFSLFDRITQASGTALPFPDNYFDATYSCDVLEHVLPSDRLAFLSEMVRVTKPGGSVLLTAFFRNTRSFRLWGAGYLILRRSLPDWYWEHLVIHLPSEEETLDYLGKQLIGMRLVRYQRTLNLLLFWLQVVACGHKRLSAMLERFSVLVPKCDLFGRTTSTFFAGTKPF